jgi:hypothetical protein
MDYRLRVYPHQGRREKVNHEASVIPNAIADWQTASIGDSDVFGCPDGIDGPLATDMGGWELGTSFMPNYFHHVQSMCVCQSLTQHTPVNIVIGI